ncbi:MAG: hypothetical protein KF721_04425 [Ignavibacteriaceae bacterium]|nr:hypothetical protein [Ignavibacteriaceae bacterium]
MTITTNSIGNYSPIIQPKVVQQAQQKMEVDKSAEKITGEEKKFFSELYPERKDEILDYHFYQRSGKMAGVTLGSNFDRRG